MTTVSRKRKDVWKCENPVDCKRYNEWTPKL